MFWVFVSDQTISTVDKCASSNMEMGFTLLLAFTFSVSFFFSIDDDDDDDWYFTATFVHMVD